MHFLIKLYRLINILSLDVAAGAIVCALFFARIFNVHVLPYGLAALGLTVLLVYTVDHLRDAKTIQTQAASERHRFHQRNFNWVLIFAILVLAIDLVMIFFVRKQVFSWGLVLAAFVFLYLLSQRYLKFLKEIFVAMLYTAGILLPSITVTNISLAGFHIVLITQLFIVALTNLLIFSWFDNENDSKDQQHSFVTIFGKSATEICIYILVSINFIGCFFIWRHDQRTTLIFAAMNTMLFVIFLMRRHLAQQEYFRLLGEIVFFLPAIYFL